MGKVDTLTSIHISLLYFALVWQLEVKVPDIWILFVEMDVFKYDTLSSCMAFILLSITILHVLDNFSTAGKRFLTAQNFAPSTLDPLF